MRTGIIIAAAAAIVVLLAGIYMIDIDQTQEGELPEISVDGGELPEYDADVGDIEITEETVTVPGIEVTPPQDDS